MEGQNLYDLLSAVLVFVVGIVFIYLSIKLKAHLRRLTIAFAVFVIIHGSYHVGKFFGYEFVADSILEPISVVALILFGIAFFKVKSKQEVKL